MTKNKKQLWDEFLSLGGFTELPDTVLAESTPLYKFETAQPTREELAQIVFSNICVSLNPQTTAQERNAAENTVKTIYYWWINCSEEYKAQKLQTEFVELATEICELTAKAFAG